MILMGRMGQGMVYVKGYSMISSDFHGILPEKSYMKVCWLCG